MKPRTPLRTIVTATLGIAISASALAQSSRIDRGSVSHERFGLYWETHLDPPAPPLADGFGTASMIDASGVVHRVLLDRSRKVYFGYDVIVQPLSQSNTYGVTFQPLTLPFELSQKLFGSDSGSWTLLPPPAFPTVQTVRGGQVLQLSLLTSSAWGQTLVDYVTVQESWRRVEGFDTATPREFAFARGAARDFAAEDVEMRLEAPRVSINGKLEQSSLRIGASATGAVVWVYMPNRGRYLLSLTPHPEIGFGRAGEVRGSSLTFSIDGETFTLTTAGPVAPGQAAFNLYVLHDPAWRPTYPDANLDAYILGAADRAEYLVPR
jgi:hypothetical protein